MDHFIGFNINKSFKRMFDRIVGHEVASEWLDIRNSTKITKKQRRLLKRR